MPIVGTPFGANAGATGAAASRSSRATSIPL